MKITLDDITLDVIITRKKIKNIYFRIKEDLKLYISCNTMCTNSYIEKLIIKNKKDIIKMYLKEKNKKTEDGYIYYLGTKMKYVYNPKILIDEDIIYGPSIEKIEEYLKTICINIFSQRLNSIKIQFNNLPVFKLRVRTMKTRWGVCNKSSMTVTLNTELIHKDVSLIDYVLVHELCHFKYMDHSSSFWREVEKYYPYYKLARKRLK